MERRRGDIYVLNRVCFLALFHSKVSVYIEVLVKYIMHRRKRRAWLRVPLIKCIPLGWMIKVLIP